MSTEACAFPRSAGILMPISSLPSRYGIGSLGKEALHFIDMLADCAQSYWQVLPMNPTSYGDSPYQSPASMAINPYFIDLPTLVGEGLLTKIELKSAEQMGTRVDYGRLFAERYSLLRRAAARFHADESYAAFLQNSADWIDDYALFMALKVKNSYRPWTEWESEDKSIKSAKEHLSTDTELQKECEFWRFVQFQAFKQWASVRAHAKERGITVIGDLPIYVAHDSVDVWRAREQFLLDDGGYPTRVAGCPPDAYAEDGQLWGNPIYDWERMSGDGFHWWCDRVAHSLDLYDVLRIDHFRGFAGYYSIPYNDETARRGDWRSAPGIELFDMIKSRFPAARIIAEDLGFITDDVRALLAHTGFPGMKLLQFAFYDENSEYLPKNYATDNFIVYTASHDSDCTRSWYSTLNARERTLFRKECKTMTGEHPTAALIRCAMQSRAAVAIIPIQDYMELGSDARMNTPSVPDGNWQWRISPRYDTPRLRERISSVTLNSARASNA